MSAPIKHESLTQPGQFYWAEAVNLPARMRTAQPMHCIVSGGKGMVTTEAFDDWFPNLTDADAIAQKLARGEL